MEEEIWLPVVEYKGLYEVSNLGRVRSLKFGKIRILNIRYSNNYNYNSCSVRLYKLGVSKQNQVSRLVAKAFISNPESKPHVNHIDNNPLNNRLENLEWCTPKENMEHAAKQNRMHKGEKKLGKGKKYNGTYTPPINRLKYMKDKIQIAIENGWEIKGYKFAPSLYTSQKVQAISKLKYKERICLDPLFWQALSKGLGWPEYQKVEGHGNMQSFKFAMHRFVDHVASDGDMDEFFNKLN